jgi:hypothetical protein
MIKFTIVSGKIVLDPTIALLKPLHDLYKEVDGQKYLQLIYYIHSTEADNPFRNLDQRVLEENVLQAVFNKRSWADLKMSKETNLKYSAAEELFLKYNSTSETRLLKSINAKLDQIAVMLDDNVPVIEQSISNSGETKFTSNLTIMLSAFSKIETIMKSKTLLQGAIAKTEGAGRARADASTSFRERGAI